MRTARADSSMTLSSLPESLPSSFSIAVDDVEDVDGSPMHGGSNAGGSVGGNQLVAVSQDEQNSQWLYDSNRDGTRGRLIAKTWFPCRSRTTSR